MSWRWFDKRIWPTSSFARRLSNNKKSAGGGLELIIEGPGGGEGDVSNSILKVGWRKEGGEREGEEWVGAGMDVGAAENGGRDVRVFGRGRMARGGARGEEGEDYCGGSRSEATNNGWIEATSRAR